MNNIPRSLACLAFVLCLAGCLSSSVPYLPASDFECRLSVWPTFDAPLELLVQSDFSGRRTVTEFRYRGAGAYAPKRSGVPRVRAIDPKQWGNFAEALKSHDPWSIPIKQPYSSGVDGTFMILELREGNRTHRVQRWSPFAHKSEKKLVEFSTAIISLLPDSR